jgi:hypothetical protein
MDADKRIGSREPDSQYVELAVEVFAMLADATRVRIILALRDGELPVNRLAEMVHKSPAAVSQHLAKMRLGRMVTTRQAERAFSTGWKTSTPASSSATPSSRPNTPSGNPRHHHSESGDLS